MNRREVLTGAGVALTTPFVGCSSIGGGGASPDIPSSPKDYPYTVGGITNIDPERTVETTEIGSRDGVDGSVPPHHVDVWNNGDVREIELRVIEYDPTAIVHEEVHEIPDDTSLQVTLLEPSLYLIEVTVPALWAETTVRVDCLLFDGFRSRTMIEVRANGALPSGISTLQGGSPSTSC